MSKFKVGDKVVIRDDLQNYEKFGTLTVTQSMRDMHGKTSTITDVFFDGDTVYQLDRYRISGSPWLWCNDCFSSSKASYPVTVITTDGTTTTATLREGKRTIRTATAKCSPADTFDYATGAKLAFDRLFTEVTEAAPEPPKQKYYTGKVVCVKSGYPWWTVGKVYDIMDGTITADDGDKYSGYISAEDARHAGRIIGGAPFPGSDAGHNPNNEFIPFVEE